MGVASIVTANPTGKAAEPSTNMYVLSLSHYPRAKMRAAAIHPFPATGY
jgi:hypothetical protein